jgi:nitrite reductase/ring-hydroxylating ferredoxin subunit
MSGADVTEHRYVDVTTLDALDEAFVTRFLVAGRAIILTRTAAGVRAFDGTCSHADFQFSTSRLVRGREIECPMHGALFDAATGAVAKGPATRPLRCLTAYVQDGVVRIAVDWDEDDEDNS